MTTASKQAVPTKVLIVEDDPNIVDLIRSNLAVRGFDTVVCAGSKVLTLLDTEQPDMVLLDLMLPEADGFELCRQIREWSPVAIIVVSARGGERDKVTALNMGADDYMTKPFGIDELLARIRVALRHVARPGTGTEPRITSGELVGVLFDSNLEGLANRFGYGEREARSVAVDVRAMVEALDKVYRADHLVRELNVRR